MKYGYQPLFAALFLVLMVLSLPIRSSEAEQYPVGIAGRVTTLDGAVVSGAEIEFLQGKKKLTTKAKTDSKGEYWLELKPGIYDVSVELPSFKPAKRKNIKVEANGKSIVDFVLQPGKPIVIE
jgi:hypothetical protein